MNRPLIKKVVPDYYSPRTETLVKENYIGRPIKPLPVEVLESLQKQALAEVELDDVADVLQAKFERKKNKKERVDKWIQIKIKKVKKYEYFLKVSR